MICEFFKPNTVAQAVALKQKNPQAVFMAGGTWINSSRSELSPDIIISLSNLKLDKIEKSDALLMIGATTPLQEIADHPLVPESIKQNICFFRNRNIRNQATLAGLIATKSPAFHLIPLLLSMKTKLVLANGQLIDMEEYVLGSADDLILNVRIPLKGRQGSAVHQITKRGVALISVAVCVSENKIRMALSQDGGKIERLRLIEKTLLNKPLPDQDMLAKHIAQNVVSFDDYRSSEDFKKHIIGELMADCLLNASKE